MFQNVHTIQTMPAEKRGTFAFCLGYVSSRDSMLNIQLCAETSDTVVDETMVVFSCPSIFPYLTGLRFEQF